MHSRISLITTTPSPREQMNMKKTHLVHALHEAVGGYRQQGQKARIHDLCSLPR
jgi:hypothetical protein